MNNTRLLVIVDPHNEFGFLDTTNFNIQFMLNKRGRTLTDRDLTPIGFRQFCQDYDSEYVVATFIDGEDYIQEPNDLNEDPVLSKWLDKMSINANFFLRDGIQEYYLFIPRYLLQRASEAGMVYDYYTFLDILRDQFMEKNNREPNDRELINLISSNNGFIICPTTSLMNFGSRTAESLGKQSAVIQKRENAKEVAKKSYNFVWWIVFIVLIICIIGGVVGSL
ncbi:hypothetical protein [Mycoplasma sp. 48589B]